MFKQTIYSFISYIKPEALRPTIAYYLLAVCGGLGIGVLGPTLPSLAEQTGSSIGQMGLLLLIGSMGSILGTWLSGRLYGKKNAHRILGGAQIGVGCMIALMPIVPVLWLLLVVMFFRLLIIRLVSVGYNMLLMWTYGEKMGPVMNGLHFSLGLGAFLSPLILAQVFQFGIGYQWVYWLLAFITIGVGVFVYTLPGNPAPPPEQRNAATEIKPTNYGMILVSALFLLFYVGTELAFSGWLFTYATALGLANEVQAAYLTSSFWLAFTFGRLISIPIATRFAPRQTLFVTITGSLGFAALMVIFPSSVKILWLAVIGFGLCMAPLWPTGFTLASQINILDARLTSLVMLGDSAGVMVLPWLTGKVMESATPSAMVIVVSISLAAALICVLLMNDPEEVG
jgi:MFS transporter, FHS family, Na+ dependent glucose transporter 1